MGMLSLCSWTKYSAPTWECSCSAVTSNCSPGEPLGSVCLSQHRKVQPSYADGTAAATGCTNHTGWKEGWLPSKPICPCFEAINHLLRFQWNGLCDKRAQSWGTTNERRVSAVEPSRQSRQEQQSPQVLGFSARRWGDAARLRLSRDLLLWLLLNFRCRHLPRHLELF